VSCTCSEEDLVDGLVDTADTGALGHTDSDVSSVTPGGVPGVTDDVVTLIALVTVANSLDGVIKLGWAAISLGDDTRGVSHEDVVAGGDSDGDGSLLNASLDGVGVGRALSVSRGVGDTFSGVIGASGLLTSGARGVRVVRLSHGHVGFEPLPGVVVPATVATVVGEEATSAIDELLRGHDDLVVAGNDVGGLDGLSGREGPA